MKGKQMNSLSEDTEANMVHAHQSGMAYWKRNKPLLATRSDITSLAHTLGYYRDQETAFVAGFFGAKRREGGGL